MFHNSRVVDLQHDGINEFIIATIGSPPRIVSHDLSEVVPVSSGRPDMDDPGWEVTAIVAVADLTPEPGLEFLASDSYSLDLYDANGTLLARANPSPHVSMEGVLIDSPTGPTLVVPRSNAHSSKAPGPAFLSTVRVERNDLPTIEGVNHPYDLVIEDLVDLPVGQVYDPLLQHDLDGDGHAEIVVPMNYLNEDEEPGPGFFVLDGRTGILNPAPRKGNTFSIALGNIEGTGSTHLFVSFNNVSPKTSTPGLAPRTGELLVYEYDAGSLFLKERFPADEEVLPAVLCDLDGDGVDELLMTTFTRAGGPTPTGAHSSGMLTIYSKGEVLWSHEFKGGSAYMPSVVDYNEDGSYDLVLSTRAAIGYVFSNESDPQMRYQTEWDFLLERERILPHIHERWMATLPQEETYEETTPMPFALLVAFLVLGLWSRSRSLDRKTC